MNTGLQQVRCWLRPRIGRDAGQVRSGRRGGYRRRRSAVGVGQGDRRQRRLNDLQHRRGAAAPHDDPSTPSVSSAGARSHHDAQCARRRRRVHRHRARARRTLRGRCAFHRSMLDMNRPRWSPLSLLSSERSGLERRRDQLRLARQLVVPRARSHVDGMSATTAAGDSAEIADLLPVEQIAALVELAQGVGA